MAICKTRVPVRARGVREADARGDEYDKCEDELQHPEWDQDFLRPDVSRVELAIAVRHIAGIGRLKVSMIVLFWLSGLNAKGSVSVTAKC